MNNNKQTKNSILVPSNTTCLSKGVTYTIYSKKKLTPKDKRNHISMGVSLNGDKKVETCVVSKYRAPINRTNILLHLCKLNKGLVKSVNITSMVKSSENKNLYTLGLSKKSNGELYEILSDPKLLKDFKFNLVKDSIPNTNDFLVCKITIVNGSKTDNGSIFTEYKSRIIKYIPV